MVQGREGNLDRRILQTAERLVASKHTATARKYLGVLNWLARRERADPHTTTTLSATISGLSRRHGRTKRTRKALPMTQAVAQRIWDTHKSAESLVVLFAQITGARVGDVLHLRPDAILWQDNDMIVVWGRTKTNPEAAPRPDHHQLVRDALPTLLPLKRNPNVFRSATYERVRTLLRRIPVQPRYHRTWLQKRPNSLLRDHWSGHSMKRGRAATLWADAARGRTTIANVMRVLKHKTQQSALEYCPCPVYAARALELEATQRR